jgi:integrase
LAWEKFDWTERTITVDQQVQRLAGKGAGLAITKTKGDKELIWPLNPTLYQAFYDLWSKSGQPKEGLLFRRIKDPSKPLDPTTWYRDFKSHVRLAGLPENFRAHDLRHTAATNVINRGGTTKDAAEMWGHRSTGHTERYARKLGMDRKRQTAELTEQTGQRQDQD